jgi:hypothetical protein
VDYTNKKYNSLTFVRYARPGGKGVGAYWLLTCDCGNKVTKLAKDVRAGRVKSCGNCQTFRRHKAATLGEKERTRRAIAKAIKRAAWEGAEWGLTPAQYTSIISGVCRFCGENKDRGVVPVRVEEGYTLGNCLPECGVCRRYRGISNLADFLDYIYKVIANQLNLKELGIDRL